MISDLVVSVSKTQQLLYICFICTFSKFSCFDCLIVFHLAFWSNRCVYHKRDKMEPQTMYSAVGCCAEWEPGCVCKFPHIYTWTSLVKTTASGKERPPSRQSVGKSKKWYLGIALEQKNRVWSAKRQSTKQSNASTKCKLFQVACPM